jgi:hypothetical protein
MEAEDAGKKLGSRQEVCVDSRRGCLLMAGLAAPQESQGSLLSVSLLSGLDISLLS